MEDVDVGPVLEPVLYNCDHCPKKYTDKSTLKYHTIIHTNDSPFPCQKCDKQFAIESKLKYHIDRVHQKKLDEICFVCNKEFYNKSALRKHLTIHDASSVPDQTYLPEILVPDLKKFGRVNLETVMIEEHCVCSVCLKIFTGGPSRRRHEELHNNPKKHKSFMENRCLDITQNPNALSEMSSIILSTNFEIQKTNTIDNRSLNATKYAFQCETCQRGVTSEEALEEHIRKKSHKPLRYV